MESLTVGWIGVDLDGTLAEYDSWKGIEHTGRPLAPMVARVRGWLEEGKEVRIFTARVCEGPDAVAHIQAWLVDVAGLPVLPITNVKDFAMVTIYDDRAVRVIENVGVPHDGLWRDV